MSIIATEGLNLLLLIFQLSVPWMDLSRLPIQREPTWDKTILESIGFATCRRRSATLSRRLRGCLRRCYIYLATRLEEQIRTTYHSSFYASQRVQWIGIPDKLYSRVRRIYYEVSQSELLSLLLHDMVHNWLIMDEIESRTGDDNAWDIEGICNRLISELVFRNKSSNWMSL